MRQEKRNAEIEFFENIEHKNKTIVKHQRKLKHKQKTHIYKRIEKHVDMERAFITHTIRN